MLRVTRAVQDALVDHARAGAPEEVCGILAGERGDPATATSAHPVENVAETPETRYRIDPEEQLRVMEDVEAAGDEMVGFYHSHPAGPRGPSVTDEARATWPDRSYVIVSLDGESPFVGAWRWTGEGFAAERVRVTD